MEAPQDKARHWTIGMIFKVFGMALLISFQEVSLWMIVQPRSRLLWVGYLSVRCSFICVELGWRSVEFVG